MWHGWLGNQEQQVGNFLKRMFPLPVLTMLSACSVRPCRGSVPSSFRKSLPSAAKASMSAKKCCRAHRRKRAGCH